jgi:hypothetical protein
MPVSNELIKKGARRASTGGVRFEADGDEPMIKQMRMATAKAVRKHHNGSASGDGGGYGSGDDDDDGYDDGDDEYVLVSFLFLFF